jgi:hypothetical protein
MAGVASCSVVPRLLLVVARLQQQAAEARAQQQVQHTIGVAEAAIKTASRGQQEQQLQHLATVELVRLQI